MRKIQILGTGCAKCQKLAENAEKAAKEMEGDYEVEKITDINRITEFGVLVTPALALDGMVLVSGKVLSAMEIKKIISKY
jgi:small redox-active disulfide protein 2